MNAMSDPLVCVADAPEEPPPPDFLAPWRVRRRVTFGHGAHDDHIITYFRARATVSALAIRRAARDKAALAIAGTPGGAAEARERGERETIRAGVKEAFMLDEDILDSMGLSRLQRDVAAYLRGLWADCLPGYEAPMAYASGGGGKRHLSADQEAAAGRAWFDYRKAMQRLDDTAGVRCGNAVRDAVLQGRPAYPPHVKDGLDVLADHWRMVKPQKSAVDR